MILARINDNYGSCQMVIFKLCYSFYIYWLAFYSKQGSPLFLHLFIYVFKNLFISYHYGFVDSYYYLLGCSDCPRFSQWGSPRWLLCPFDMTHRFLITFLLYVTIR